MTPSPTWAAALLPSAVLLPLAWAVLCVLVPTRARRALGPVGALATAAVGISIAVAVAVGGPVEAALAGRLPPLGIAVRADGPGAVFLLLTSIVGALVSVFAAIHPRSTGAEGARDWFWPAWLLGWSGLAAVFLSADLFNLYVAIEIVGLAAVLLVALGGRDAWRAAFRYLVVTVTGSLLFLVALTLVYAATGALDLRLAGERLAAGEPGVHVTVILALAATGMAFKSALFPLHGWLPDAHGGAPGAVSPLLSALVVKSSFFVLFRVWTEVTGPDAAVGTALGIAAAGSVMWAGVAAVRTPRFKRLVGYSTVSQVGYLFLFFPLSAAADGPGQQRAAWIAVALLAFAHGLAKSSLFLSAGLVKDQLGTDRIDAMTDQGARMPLVTMAIAVAGVSLAGLPITLGFAGKWQLLLAAVDTAEWWVAAVAVAGTLVAATYLLRPVQTMLSGESSENRPGSTRRGDDPDAGDRDARGLVDENDDEGRRDGSSAGAEVGRTGIRSAPRAGTLIPLTGALLAALAIAASGPLADLAVLGLALGGQT
ncbi:complex I subunit 5 family protein [Dietzia maris]|uniref:complex I subunit 5 family protein n=1 Tax=Dietzia maris TaxID=37915 RepID=UPI0010F3FD8F|nr:proton-conducting transporter membrane subunit [Dietzia maris]MCT1434289.1 hydrogenase 4 subunit B [Dietzia maris]MCT1521258.1 hydrogenase 4 subunit B [Dietzia maris]